MKIKSLVLLGTVICVICIIAICLVTLSARANTENESEVGVRLKPQYGDLVDKIGMDEAIKQKGDIFLHPTDEEIKEYLRQNPIQAHIIVAESFYYDSDGEIVYRPELQSMIMDIQGPYPDLDNSPYSSVEESQYHN